MESFFNWHNNFLSTMKQTVHLGYVLRVTYGRMGWVSAEEENTFWLSKFQSYCRNSCGTCPYHYTDVTWTLWHLKWQANLLFVQYCFQTNNKSSTLLALCEGNPFTKGQWCGALVFFQANNKENIKALHYWLTHCEDIALVTSGFPSQRASNAERVSMSWWHHV